jgi:hypothetical protein
LVDGRIQGIGKVDKKRGNFVKERKHSRYGCRWIIKENSIQG